jgi:hypothetical protein
MYFQLSLRVRAHPTIRVALLHWWFCCIRLRFPEGLENNSSKTPRVCVGHNVEVCRQVFGIDLDE